MISDKQRALEIARAYVDAKRPNEAIKLIEAELVKSPEDVDWLKLLAFAELKARRAGNKDIDLIATAEHLARVAPNDSFAWRLISDCYSRSQMYKKGQVAARTARRIDPGNVRTHLCVVSRDVDGYLVSDDTRFSMNEAMRLAPQFVDTHIAAGRMEQVNFHNRAAMVHYQRALEIDPGNYWARFNLAMVQKRMGMLGTAARTFVTDLSLDQNARWCANELHETAFFVLRNIYVVVVAVSLVATILGYLDPPLVGTRMSAAIAAIVAIGAVLGYLAWIRRNAGPAFKGLVRGYRLSKQPQNALWLGLVTAGLLALVVAPVLPVSISRWLYSLTATALGCALLVVSTARRVTRWHRRRVRRAK